MTTAADYDDPLVEEQWCAERQTQVAEYLKDQGVTHGLIGEWPAWHVAPYVSVWAIESTKQPGWMGWWSICGDLPSDYISALSIKHPRDAIRAIAERWLEVAPFLEKGQPHPTIRVGSGDKELAPLLRARAEQLLEWAGNASLWEE